MLSRHLRKRAASSTASASAALKTLNRQHLPHTYHTASKAGPFDAVTLKGILSTSSITAQQQHSNVPEELFKLIRRVMMEKNPDFSALLERIGLFADESENKLLESNEGVKFMLPKDLREDLKSESWWGWNEKVVQESLEEGTSFLLDIPAANTARFLFLTKLKKRISVCKKSLNLFQRSDYYLIKSKEYDFLMTIVNLLLLKCAIPPRSSPINKVLASQLVERSLNQVRLFFNSCPRSFFEPYSGLKRNETSAPAPNSNGDVDTNLKECRLKSAQFRYARHNLFANHFFIKSELFKYLAIVRLEALGLDNTVEWIINDAHLLSFELGSNITTSPYFVDLMKKEKQEENQHISLIMNQIFCNYLLMNLCIAKDFDRARALLDCAASVYNLETTNLNEKYLFNKKLSEAAKNPFKILDSLETLKNPTRIHFEIVIRDLLRFQTARNSEAATNNSKSSAEFQNVCRQEAQFVFASIQGLLKRMKELKLISPNAIMSIMDYFKNQNQFQAVIQTYDMYCAICDSQSSGKTLSSDRSTIVKGHTIALEAYFALQDLSKATSLFRQLKERGEIDGYVLHIFMKNMIKMGHEEAALEAYDSFTSPSSSSKNTRRNVPEPVYSLLMATLVGQNNLGAASEVWNEMVAQGYPPTSSHIALFIKGYGIRLNDLTRARDCFESAFRLGVVPDAYLYNALINVYMRNHQYKEALFIYDEMKAKGVQPDVATECLVVNIYSLLGKEKEMLSSFDMYLMIASRSRSSPAGHRILSGRAIVPIIDFYAKRDNYGKVFEYIHLLEDGNRESVSQRSFDEKLLENLSGNKSSFSTVTPASLVSKEDREAPVAGKMNNQNRLPFDSTPRAQAVLLDLEIAHERVLRSLYRNQMNKSLIDGYVELLLERGKIAHSPTTVFPILWNSYMNFLITSKQFQKLRAFFYNVVLERGVPSQRNYLTFIKGMYKLGDQTECIKGLRAMLDKGFVPSKEYFRLAKAVEVMKYRIIRSHSEMNKAAKEKRMYRKLRKRELDSRAKLVSEAKMGRWIEKTRSQGLSASRIRLNLAALKRRTGRNLQRRARKRGGQMVTRLIRRRKTIFSQLEALYPKHT